MGWTGMKAKYYYKNGMINRKKECDELIEACLDDYIFYIPLSNFWPNPNLLHLIHPEYYPDNKYLLAPYLLIPICTENSGLPSFGQLF